MIESKYMKAFSEIDTILSNTDQKLVEKIPYEIREYIKENQDEKYVFILSSYIPLENHILMDETKNILALFDLLYWSTDKEKVKFLNDNKKNINDMKDITELLNIKPVINSSNIFTKIFKR